MSSKKKIISKEYVEIGERIRKFLESHSTSQADLARVFSKRKNKTFEGENVKIGRILLGQYEADYDFWVYLYETWEVNIGYLLTKKGKPHVKSFKKEISK